ncbi:MAG: hybrid sensor histidine kinase/response regulator transcription factor, partial [Bacteroidota bacterium]
MATNEGLCIYDRESDNFKNFEDQYGKSLSNSIVTTIIEDKEENFWIGTFNGGLNYYNEKKDSFYIIQNDHNSNRLTSNTIRTICEDDEGLLWIGTRNGLNKYDPHENNMEFYYFHPEEVTGGNDIRYIYADESERLLLATNGGGLIKFIKKTGDFQINNEDSDEAGTLKSNTVRSIIRDNSGTLWIGTLNGLFLYDEKDNLFHHYKHNPDDPGTLNTHSVRAIFQDRDGNIWLGLYYGGINFYNQKNSQFQNFTERGPNNSGLSSNIISSFVEDKNGNLWIGTEGGGLNYFNRKTGQFKHYLNQSDKKSISSNFIKSLAIDKNGKLWIGTIEAGLDYFDPVTSTFQNYRNDPSDFHSLSNNYIRSIYIDSKENIWVGTNGNGLNKFNARNNKFERLPYDNGENTIHGSNINSIIEDSSGLLIIGTNKGLNIYNPETYQNRFINSIDKGNPLSEIWCFYIDKENNLWIGTNENGLVYYNRQDEIFRSFTQEDALLNNVVYGIIPDNNGYLWVSTNRGLSRFDIEDHSVKNFESHSGLLSNQFNYNSYYKTRDGELLFGGNRGFTLFHPDEIHSNTIMPPAVITGFKLFNKPVDLKDKDSPLNSNIIIAEEVTLNHKQTVFSIEFASLSYIAPENNQYEYTLEGFLDAWIYLGNNRSVTFTNLDPGKYIFKLRASNNDGMWNEAGTSLAINVLPPWWKTGWAFSAYSLFFLGLFLIAVKAYKIRVDERNKLKYERLEKQRIIELNQMKLRFFTNISHEFRTPLSLIIGPVEELVEKFRNSQDGISKKLSVIQKNSITLHHLIEQLMTFRKIEAGALKLKIQKLELVSYLSHINDSFLDLAGKKNIKFRFSHEISPLPIWIDPDMMEKVFINILSNAFHHTPKNGEVEISAFQNTHTGVVEIKISDTGPGIPEDKLEKIFERFYQIDNPQADPHHGTGIGLSFARDIINLHAGSISAKNLKGKGVCFIIRIKAGKEHLKEHILIESGDLLKEEEKKIITTDNSKGMLLTEEVNEDINNTKKDLSKKYKILVVEDNESLNNYLSDTLSEEYQVCNAFNGKQGLTQARVHNPDLIIMDVMMPELGGIELTNMLKTDFETCHIPIIMLTAKSSLNDEIEGFEKGADAYISKPFSMKLLKTQISSLLQNRENLRKVFNLNLKLNPTEVNIQSMDDKFIKHAMKIVEDNIAEEKLNVQLLAEELGMSRMQLNRKMKGLLNQSPSDFIRIVRLKRASQLMTDGKLNVSEVIYHVGINSRTYFTKAFKDQFGMSPKEYA